MKRLVSAAIVVVLTSGMSLAAEIHQDEIYKRLVGCTPKEVIDRMGGKPKNVEVLDAGESFVWVYTSNLFGFAKDVTDALLKSKLDSPTDEHTGERFTKITIRFERKKVSGVTMSY